MGNDCSVFHRSGKPNATFPNKNICTVYEEGKYDPNNPQNNAITIDVKNDKFDQLDNSAFLSPTDLCIPNESTLDIIELVTTTLSVVLPATAIVTLPAAVGTAGGYAVATGNKAFDYCANISEVNPDGTPEWVLVTSKDSLGKTVTKPYSHCLYDDSDNQTRIAKPGCCGTRCAISGQRIECRRNAFNADPIPCCFMDYECANDNGIEDACWQTSDRRKTCDPRYRNLSSKTCLEKIKPYCTGEKLFAGQNNWMEAWIPNSGVDVNSGEDTATVNTESNKRFLKQPCLRALARAVYDDSGGVCTWEEIEKLDIFQGLIKPDGLLWAQEVLDSILDRYTKEFGSPIGKINQDGYLGSSDFLDFYYGLCKKFPFICQRSLGNLCASVKKEDMIEGPELLKWCGCYMKDSEYKEYEKFSIDRQCTPTCNSQGNIPLVGEDNIPLICTQTTCIIDDLSINLARVSNPDGVDFNQICNSCGQSKVSKYFDGSNKSDSKTNKGPNFFISGGTGTLEQFIPDTAAEAGVSFWYSIKYDNGVYDNDDLLIRLQQCEDTSRFKYFHPIKKSNDPIVTLNHESQYFSDFNGQGSGTLYYVSGIKNIYYGGDIKTDPLSPDSFAGVNGFLNNNSKVEPGLCFNGFVSDDGYYTAFTDATVGGKTYAYSTVSKY